MITTNSSLYKWKPKVLIKLNVSVSLRNQNFKRCQISRERHGYYSYSRFRSAHTSSAPLPGKLTTSFRFQSRSDYSTYRNVPSLLLIKLKCIILFIRCIVSLTFEFAVRRGKIRNVAGNL